MINKSNYMSLNDYNELLIHISKYHSMYVGGKRIKYVKSSFDTRTNCIYSIQLDSEDFTVVNENRKRNLKKWIYAYLNNESDGFDPARDDPDIDWARLKGVASGNN